ncbi:MAG: flagellar hook-length control protein FliK [Lachnospiraceae bacterium]|nr:flagellar hook-length control protein FliK [Lachnospiraceae bacterium]
MVNGIRLDDQSIGNNYNDLRSQVQQIEGENAVEAGRQVSENAAETSANATFGGINTTARMALEDAGLPVNERNMSLVREMINNQMSIDRGSVSRLVSQVNVFREADVSTLLLMNKNNIPVTHFTAAQLQAYINNEQNLSEQIGDAINTLMELLDTEASAQGTITANMQVLELLSEGNGVFTENMAALGSADNIMNMAEMAGNGQDSVLSTLMTGQGSAGAVYAAGAQQAAVVADETAVMNMLETGSVSNVIAELGTDAEGSGANWMNGFGADNDSLGNFNEFNTENSQTGLNGNMLASSGEGKGGETSLSALLNENDIQDLNNLFNKVFGEKAEFGGDRNAAEVLKEIYQNASGMDDTKLQELFKSETYQKLVKSALNSKFTLKASDIDSSEAINDYYKETFAALSKLSDIAGKEGEVAEKMSKPMDNMKFMDTLNNVFPYIQLPLKLNDGQAHGELYVFKKGRNKTDPGDTKSVLLHLDMDSLGPTDIHMELKTGFLKLRFYCTDEASKTLLSENFSGLEEVLNAKGFSISSEFNIRTEDTRNMVEALSGDGSVPEFKYNFDVKL